jgi:hypothetical protein
MSSKLLFTTKSAKKAQTSQRLQIGNFCGLCASFVLFVVNMAVAKLLDSRKRPALKRRAKQQRPVYRPEKARRASLISPTVYRRAFAAGTKLTLQQPYRGKNPWLPKFLSPL